jgi:hypothetical protein
VGSYDNSHYGTLVVTTDNGGFLMQLGPKSIELALRHYDGDTFTTKQWAKTPLAWLVWSSRWRLIAVEQ